MVANTGEGLIILRESLGEVRWSRDLYLTLTVNLSRARRRRSLCPQVQTEEENCTPPELTASWKTALLY